MKGFKRRLLLEGKSEAEASEIVEKERPEIERRHRREPAKARKDRHTKGLQKERAMRGVDRAF